MFTKRDSATTVKEVVERNTGIKSEEFLKEVREPFLKFLKEIVEFVKKYLEEHPNATITIVGDYDSDGINATTIIYYTFLLLGIKVVTRLPRRFSEGYGLSTKIIDEIQEGLVITVDNGIKSIEAIQKAKNKGLSVVVIDHHLPSVDDKGNVILPPADVVLDPHTEDESEFKDYCGAALAYRFAKEMFPDKKLKDLLVMASIATVTDVMPLVGANRTLVIDGLQAINKGRGVPGLKALLPKLGLTEHINEGDYGFKIGPTFNAAGRLYDNGAEKVLDVMKMERDNPLLPWKVDALVKTNEKRKELVKENMLTVETMLTGKRPIVLYNPDFGEGIVGILAGKITEMYKCPCIVFGDSENPDIIKGSGRSIPEIDLAASLDKIKDKMVKYGGHAGAAGLSIKKDMLEEFETAFEEAVGELPRYSDDILYDLELDDRRIDLAIEELSVYAPYGEGNPKPIYHLTYDINMKNYEKMGDGTHFKIEDEHLTLVGFGLSEKMDKLLESGEVPKRLECVGYLQDAWFDGNRKFKFEIIDFCVA